MRAEMAHGSNPCASEIKVGKATRTRITEIDRGIVPLLGRRDSKSSERVHGRFRRGGIQNLRIGGGQAHIFLRAHLQGRV